MGHQILRQPDGLFAIFSSVVDSIIVYDATADEIVEHFAARAADDAARRTRQIIEHVEAGEPRKAYYQFALTWDEALDSDREHGGEAWRYFRKGSSDGD